MKGSLTFAYAATGDRYIAEARQSAASCKRHVPGCRAIILTPDTISDDGFDQVIPFGGDITNPFELKIAGIAAVEAERFIFMDTDTFVLSDISEIYDVLDRFDLAAAQAPVRLQSNLWPEMKAFLEGAPVCFPEFNTGLIAFKRSPELTDLLESWLRLYAKHAQHNPTPKTQDQASFREVVYHSALRIATLPPEYNCRFPYPVSLCGAVRVLHGHGNAAMLENLGRQLNRSLGFRVLNRDRFARDSLMIKSS